MSEALFAALVCEGQTDVPILKAAILKIWPELTEVRCLQPELDETDRAKGAAGWTQVRAWCNASADSLDQILNPDIGDPFHLLVIAIDMDIAIEAGMVDPPKKALSAYESPRLQKKMAEWLTTTPKKKLPSEVLFTTPLMAIESWIISSHFPKTLTPEKIQDPAQWLVENDLLRSSPSNGRPWKEFHRYSGSFSKKVAQKIQVVRKACPEANRFLNAVEVRRSASR